MKVKGASNKNVLYLENDLQIKYIQKEDEKNLITLNISDENIICQLPKKFK